MPVIVNEVEVAPEPAPPMPPAGGGGGAPTPGVAELAERHLRRVAELRERVRAD